MILIADSGSTKTEWVLANNGNTVISRQKTEGINPFHQSEEEITRILQTLSVEDARITEIHFYGSGVRPELCERMQSLLKKRFGVDHVEAVSDLLGAARALCGHTEGIACILGTGANSCLYDGSTIVQNTPALGYILGDEGSGAVLGRNLLNAIYKGVLSAEIRERFECYTNLSMNDVIARVYRQPMANRWMASLTYFITQYKNEYGELNQLVVNSFRDFLRLNVLPYNRRDLSVSAIGSVAWYFQNELVHAATIEGLQIGEIEQTPMEGLLRYHFS